MRSMGHPLYKYTPRSEDSRRKQRETMRRRLGIPEGHTRIYGQNVPGEYAQDLKPYAAEMARLSGSDSAKDFMKKAAEAGWEIDLPQLTTPRSPTDWELMDELMSEHMTKEEVAQFAGLKNSYFRERVKIRKRLGNRK